ncbi:hypothetical protein MRX96_010169 [Rhipicephalus microplus]
MPHLFTSEARVHKYSGDDPRSCVCSHGCLRTALPAVASATVGQQMPGLSLSAQFSSTTKSCLPRCFPMPRSRSGVQGRNTPACSVSVSGCWVAGSRCSWTTTCQSWRARCTAAGHRPPRSSGPPLLEKAYAKFLGCYELLEACSLSDALVDMTGAAAEHLELAVGGYARDPALQEQLFSKMLTLLDNSCQAVVVCCAISVEHADEMGSTTSDGLLRGHAYQVVCAREVASTDVPSWQELFRNRPQLRMLCLRNPWHHQASAWTGMLGHWSAEWSSLSEPEKTKLGIRPSDEQEFWIPLEDFAGAFTDMCVCYVPGRGGWREESFPGEWTVGERGSAMDRAGGCINHRSSFLRNPQYRLDVVEDGTVAVLAYLLQDSSSAEGSTGHFAIGMHIMQMEVNRQFRVHVIKAKVCSSEYVRARGVFLECSLQRGRYCLLPTTFEPGQARRFLLRLFCRSTLDARELQKDVPSAKLLPCQSMPALATIIRVIGAKHLEQQDPFGLADPYCVLLCEGQSVRSSVCRGTLDPTWNISVLFYRKDASTPIKIQVWNSHLMMDAYMAKAYVDAPLGVGATDAGSATCGTSEPAGQRNRWQLGNSVCRGHYH